MPYRPLEGTNCPVWVWGAVAEPQAAQQLRNLATLPWLFHHIAVMPDVHLGIGATVGTVLAAEGAVIPAAVGVDIGCGMAAARLPLERAQLERDGRLSELRRAIEGEIPLGFAQYRPGQLSPEARAWARRHIGPAALRVGPGPALLEKARLQLGTLGGGNHFIEIGIDEHDRGWVVLHSGSRHIGKQIADTHIRRAKALLTRKGRLSDLPDPNLAWFEQGEPEFDDYLHDLFWAQAYARFNRDEMLRRILVRAAAIYPELARAPSAADAGAAGSPGLVLPVPKDDCKDCKGDAAMPGPVLERVDCHHNYVARERHLGRELYVTRKGALSAKAGELAIIPGSMGARSYIVRGLGNPDSFGSCAHGAGRAMSRREAKRRFTVGDLARQTRGVDCRKDKGVLDEIPSAYKDIDQVMAAQADLVEPVHTLKQLICVKG